MLPLCTLIASAAHELCAQHGFETATFPCSWYCQSLEGQLNSPCIATLWQKATDSQLYSVCMIVFIQTSTKEAGKVPVLSFILPSHQPSLDFLVTRILSPAMNSRYLGPLSTLKVYTALTKSPSGEDSHLEIYRGELV